MGAVLGACSVAQLACCCGGAACSLCCSSCPSCRNSTSTRIVYSILLLLGTILCCVMLIPDITEGLHKIPYLCENTKTCELIGGYLAVYRIGFAMGAFFLLFALLMIGVKSSRDPRAGIQNGWWAIKILLFVGAIVGAFFIPNGNFSEIMLYVGLVGSFLFILIQLVLLIDFAHSWNESWLEKAEDNDSSIWYILLAIVTFMMYGLSIAAVVLFYVYYTQADNSPCTLNKFFISFNLIMCVVISVLAIHPRVQERQSRSGLLQSAVISVYTMFLTWSSLSYAPDTECNPGTPSNLKVNGVDAQAIVGVIGTFIMVVYACIRTTTSSQVGRLGMQSSHSTGDTETTTLPNAEHGQGTSDNDVSLEDGGHKVWDNEKESVVYSYSFFHVMMMMASLYIMMTLTNWYSPKSDFKTLQRSSAAMWVKMSSCWTCLFMYIWTLIAPIILPNRDFDNI